jgi:hypothetical protein
MEGAFPHCAIGDLTRKDLNVRIEFAKHKGKARQTRRRRFSE